MAITQVRDEQLDLSSVDQKPSFLGNTRTENTSPLHEFRETDQTLPLGLWRIILTGDQLQLQKNTAVAGDFTGTNQNRLVITDSGGVDVFGVLNVFDTNASVRFGGSAAAGSLVDNSLFRDTTDNRLHYKNVGSPSGDQTVAFVSEVIEQSNYIVREPPSGSINGVNTTFTLANTPVAGTEQVFLNGLLQEPGGSNDYTISGDTITYNTAPETGDRLVVTYLSS